MTRSVGRRYMDAHCQEDGCGWGADSSNLRGKAATKAKHHFDSTGHTVHVYVEQTIYYESPTPTKTGTGEGR